MTSVVVKILQEIYGWIKEPDKRASDITLNSFTNPEVWKRGVEALKKDAGEISGKELAEGPIYNYLKEASIATLNRIIGQADGRPETAIAARDRFLENIISLQYQTWEWGLASEVSSVGLFKSGKDLINIIYWSMGLGWLQWIAFGPMFRAAIANPLEVYYAREFQNELPTRGDVVSWRAQRSLTDSVYKSRMEDLGFNQTLQAAYLQDAYREFSISELKQLRRTYSDKELNIERRLERMKVAPNDMPYMYHLMEEGAEAAKDVITKSQAEKLLREGYKDEAWFKDFLDGKISREEQIDALIDLNTIEEVDDEKGLLESDIKDEFINGEMTEATAKTNLELIGKGANAIDIKLSRWKRLAERELKSATLAVEESLFVNGINTENQYRSWLQEKDYSDTAIESYVSKAKLKMIEEPKRLSVSQIGSAYQNNIMEEAWTRARWEYAGYPQEDIDVLFGLYARGAEAPPKERLLTPSQILNAFKQGIKSEGWARDELLANNYKESDIDVLIELYRPEEEEVG